MPICLDSLTREMIIDKFIRMAFNVDYKKLNIKHKNKISWLILSIKNFPRISMVLSLGRIGQILTLNCTIEIVIAYQSFFCSEHQNRASYQRLFNKLIYMHSVLRTSSTKQKIWKYGYPSVFFNIINTSIFDKIFLFQL